MFFKPKKEKTKIYIPTWDEVVERCYDQGLSDNMIKVAYHPTKAYRVVIVRRKDGYYQIIEEKLFACDEDELNYHPDLWGYWCRCDCGISIFESIEDAEKEARRININKYP